MPAPEAYYQFVIDYAPYLYVTPGAGPDLTWGKAALSAGFAVDFLYEAYFDPKFDDLSEQIENKIVDLADWLLTQQVTDSQKQMYGGFVSTENSTACYSVDVCRTVPALLKAYELTSNVDYLESAKLAAGTFLFNMQQKPAVLGIHERYFGGFARAVDAAGNWQAQMDVESLYGLVGLGMLCESDPAGKAKYQTMIEDAANFYRPGLEELSLFFDPLPDGDGKWHRVGVGDDTIYDDSIAYALLGLYDYEAYSGTVRKVYQAVNAIGASPQYPAYNSAVCWAGYINVKAKTLACNYYDGVAAGILGKIRQNHDKPAYDFSAKTVTAHSDEFMFWGANHANYAPIENKQAMATVCWLGQLLSNYEAPLTRFTQVLNSKGENLTLNPITQTGDVTSYGEGSDLKAIVLPGKTEETLIEPGYMLTDYLVLHVFAPVRHRDKITRNGADYEVTGFQDFMFRDESCFPKSNMSEDAELMSAIEDPVVTVARLLRTQMHVTKDSGVLAAVNVSGEYQNADAFKGYGGQVTVGLAECTDLKMDLTGKIRRRTPIIRVNVWVTDTSNSSESGKAMRGEIVEEVNRVIRRNRSKPNQTLCDFVGQSVGGQGCRAFSGDTEAPPSADWTELSDTQYQKLWYSDNNRLQVSTVESGKSAVALFRFKVESRENTIKQLILGFEGSASAPSSTGVTVKVWNHTQNAWQNAQSTLTGAPLTLTLLSGLPDFVDDEGYVWFLAKTSSVSDGAAPAVLNCDYVSCTTVVNGVTYCDLVSYRNLDRADTKPFVYRTELVLKSWFIENIGE